MDKSPKKALKKKRTQSVSQSTNTDSEESDNEVADFNGLDTTLNENEDSTDGGWSSDDDRELVQKVKSTSKDTDKVSYKTRLKQVNWNNIAFKSYSGEECEKRFQAHLKRVRRHRNLNEIATDIEANIKKCPLKKPLNSYQLFIQDQLANVKSSGDFTETMKNLGTIYKEKLSSEERAVYERKAELLRQEYKQKKAQFESGNYSFLGKTTTNAATNKTISSKVKTPFMHYMESNKEESDYSKLRELYANLSFDEKYKWVIKAVSAAPDKSPGNISKILTKEEQRIYRGQIKTTPSAFNLYIKDAYSEIKDTLDEDKRPKDVLKTLAINWKSLDKKKKKIYEDSAALLKEQAAKDQESFNERHGVVTPQRVKRRRSTYVERHPEDVIDHDEKEEETESTPKKKKKKVPDANPTDSGSDETNATKQIQFKIPPKQKPAAKLNSSKIKKTAEAQSPEKVPLPTSPIQSPVKVENEVKPEKKKKTTKREKLNSESSEHNESDAVLSSSSTGSRKRERKETNSVTIEPPSDKPPTDFRGYFKKFIHTGKPHKVDKALNKLTKKERKKLIAEYNEKCQAYLERLKSYLGTLDKDEAVDYIKRIKAAEDAENADEEAGNTSSQEY